MARSKRVGTKQRKSSPKPKRAGTKRKVKRKAKRKVALKAHKARPAPRRAKPKAKATKAKAKPKVLAANESRGVELALPPAPPAMRGPAGAAVSAFVGVAKVVADKWGDGYSFFRVRADLAEDYDALRERILASGGLVTSSGGLRAVNAPITPGRSKTSLHYTARAIDLNVSSGMQARATPYIVVRDGGSEEHPLWKVYCETALAGGEGEVRALDALVWRKGQPPAVKQRQVRCICVTDILEAGGWQRIPARSDWKNNYMSCEWWHFQNQTGLVTGVSRFGDELKKVWPAADVDRSGLALNAVWGNQSFIVS